MPSGIDGGGWSPKAIARSARCVSPARPCAARPLAWVAWARTGPGDALSTGTLVKGMIDAMDARATVSWLAAEIKTYVICRRQLRGDVVAAVPAATTSSRQG